MMQHRYVPDLGDFSKFVVIDAISGKGREITSLIWYLVDPEEVGDYHNNDGKHTAYLSDNRHGYAQCHPQLYARFKAIHGTGVKHVRVYALRDVLPNVSYFPDLLSYADQTLIQREAWRSAWLKRALDISADADVVVLDPDNGLMPERLSIRSKSAIKYASLDECRAFYASGQKTLVIYQHAHRQGGAQVQASKSLQRLADGLNIPRESVFALRFHRGTTRFYLIAPAAGQEVVLRSRAAAVIESEWGRRGHFSLID